MKIEEMEELLNKVGVKSERINIDKYGFSREIKFKIYDQEFVIQWYHNQSTLYVGKGNRSPCIPFKYLIYDNTYPLIDGNKSLAFCDELVDNPFYGKRHPFASFRIPLELAHPQ